MPDREKFEDWHSAELGGDFMRDRWGYVDPEVRRSETIWKASRKQALQEVSQRVACTAAHPGNEWGRGYAQASKDIAQGVEQLAKDDAA